MPLSIFDLPHILEQISVGLSRQDILSCSLVCYSWSRVFGPLCWRHFEAPQVDYVKVFSNPELTEIFQNRAPTIQTLTIKYSDKMWPLVHYFRQNPGVLSNNSNLTRFVFELNQSLSYVYDEFNGLGMMFQLLSMTESHLVHLVIHSSGFPIHLRALLNDSRQRFPLLRKLRTMEIKSTSVDSYYHSYLPAPSLAILLRYCPESLESLVIDFPMRGANEGVWGQDIQSFWSDATATNIRHLRLPKMLRWSEQSIIIPFLRLRCPELRTLETIPSIRASEGGAVAEALSFHCMKLEHMIFEDIRPEVLPLYAQIIRSCHQGLRSLTVKGYVHDAREVVRAIAQGPSARTITKIVWTGGGGFNGGLDLNILLESCSSLERLETGVGATGSIWIRDEPLPRSLFSTSSSTSTALITTLPDPKKIIFWACYATLTHLDVIFSLDTTVTDEERFRQQIEHTYRKIGQLEALEELRLGCNCRCYGPKLVNCMHYSFNAVNGAREIVDHFQFSGDPYAIAAADAVKSAEAAEKAATEEKEKEEGEGEKAKEKGITITVAPETEKGLPAEVDLDSEHDVKEKSDDKESDIKDKKESDVKEDEIEGESKAIARRLKVREIAKELWESESDKAILDMTLATGIGHLAGLKRLRFLCVARIKGHRIGYPELEWMRANWPQLKEIRGVRNTRIVDWIKESWPGVQAWYLAVPHV
ncbi:hypothetical protein BX616_003068 [Lobosporangium transversale]|uniref:F-box domain-containing protein n=1 Tax=Lobosporangium transversale TaxID=64571 RepID=A0A1Y2GA66_9FUNG|nr:hypothetical protein BCR41DRAFT_414227 [Lobosporangium transversale]KAF9899389.1 hypothetical protein BX616_003068 [Lobosporangium transversale]ORZ04429.1 hypothetical protein BCR41DRAFT_414227 [Lobosporangium transversale]|eukprot:XP_021876537.1 hypothetical protein BCR41DRAFT_414227 [Lobosporangium transversale]